MPSAIIYRNNDNGRKVAVRVVGCDAHFTIDDFKIENEIINEIYIDRVLYSGNVTIWRGATAETIENHMIPDGTEIIGGKALLILTGNGDWDLTTTKIENQEMASSNVTVETSSDNDTCILQLSKN